MSSIGGYDVTATPDEYAEMARAARDEGAIGVSVYDWPTTPVAAWRSLRDYDGPRC